STRLSSSSTAPSQSPGLSASVAVNASTTARADRHRAHLSGMRHYRTTNTGRRISAEPRVRSALIAPVWSTSCCTSPTNSTPTNAMNASVASALRASTTHHHLLRQMSKEQITMTLLAPHTETDFAALFTAV